MQRKADNVEITERAPAFQRSKGLALVAQLGFTVRPRRVAAFSRNPGDIVEDAIQDCRADVAHAYFIDVGKGHRKAQVDLVPVFADAATFTAQVAGRAL